jgi:hypothetical protein
MEKKIIGRLLAVAGLLLLGALAAPAWAAPTAVAACGVLAPQNSYILTADIFSASGNCLTITGNGVTINLNGHSIRGTPGTDSTGIEATPGNNFAIQGPGIVHDFDTCISLGTYSLVESVLAYNCGDGIVLGDASKCVQCRVHDARASGVPGGTGIIMGLGCLLESSIVENSDNGARVGQDCKVWDLVVDTFVRTGLKVGAGTAVARSVISHFHNGPGIDYTSCTAPGLGGVCVNGSACGCQDSSNSVFPSSTATAILDTGVPPPSVITDCATNTGFPLLPGSKYIPLFPVPQCP